MYIYVFIYICIYLSYMSYISNTEMSDPKSETLLEV